MDQSCPFALPVVVGGTIVNAITRVGAALSATEYILVLLLLLSLAIKFLVEDALLLRAVFGRRA